MNRSRLIGQVVATVVAAVLVAAAFAAAMMWHYGTERRDRIAAAETSADRVLVAFDDHASRLFSYADSYLRAVRTLYLSHGGPGAVAADDGDRLRAVIDAIKPTGNDGFVGAVGITNADGYAIFGTLSKFDRTASIANMPYFQQLKSADTDLMVINSTRQAKFSGQFTFRIARAIHVGGQFAGVIIMTLRPEAISDFYRKFDLGPNSSLTMVHTGERKLIARHPAVGADAYDRPLDNLVSWQAISTDTISTNVVAGALDGITRSFHVKALADYPVMIAVGVAPQDVEAGLAEIRANLTLLAVFFGIGVLIVAGLVILVLLNNGRLRQARAAAEAAGRRSDAILASAGEGICGIDGAGRITFINDAACKVLGWDAGDGVGRSLPLALDETAGDPAQGMVERPDGRRADVEYTVARISNDTRAGTTDAAQYVPDHQVVVFRDVTERKALEVKLTRTLAELEQFAYVASHDLRQPLRVISQYLTIIKAELGEALSDDHREYLCFAIDGAQRMNRLIVDLLEYSSTGQSPTLAPVALDQVAAEAVSNLAIAAQEADAELVVADDLPTVMGNATDLMRLLQNLIGNAIKYRAPDRAPRITVTCSADDAGNWVVAVADNGIGIKPEDRDRAFGIFQRLVTRDAYEGSGIGLAICKKIVEHHGGHIWIESDGGKGTTFLFTLPRMA